MKPFSPIYLYFASQVDPVVALLSIWARLARCRPVR
jgi:hypothetical protein